MKKLDKKAKWYITAGAAVIAGAGLYIILNAVNLLNKYKIVTSQADTSITAGTTLVIIGAVLALFTWLYKPKSQ
ncbi:hypothetical protein ACFL1A_02995 [Patescibacteria group bacterium]